MLLNNWLSLGMGVLFTAAGVMLIVFRASVVRFYLGLYQSMDIEIIDRTARSTKPSVVMAVGIVFTVAGLGSLAMGVFRRDW